MEWHHLSWCHATQLIIALRTYLYSWIHHRWTQPCTHKYSWLLCCYRLHWCHSCPVQGHIHWCLRVQWRSEFTNIMVYINDSSNTIMLDEYCKSAFHSGDRARWIYIIYIYTHIHIKKITYIYNVYGLCQWFMSLSPTMLGRYQGWSWPLYGSCI